MTSTKYARMFLEGDALTGSCFPNTKKVHHFVCIHLSTTRKGNRSMFWLPLSITTASMPFISAKSANPSKHEVTNYFPLVAYDSLQLCMSSILFWGEIWNSVPSLATSQNSKATLKAWATVSVTAWAWGNTTGQQWLNQTDIIYTSERTMDRSNI